jgi:autotransporter-associated beta strand protein
MLHSLSQRTDDRTVPATGAPKVSLPSRAFATPLKGAREVSSSAVENPHRIPDTIANYSTSNIQHPTSRIPNLLPRRPVWNIAGPVLRLGKCVGLLAVMLGVVGQVFGQSNGDTLRWNFNTATSWTSTAANKWYNTNTASPVDLSTSGRRDLTYNFIFAGAVTNGTVSPTETVISGFNLFANSVAFEQGFNSTNTTSITNGSGATASTLTLGAGNGSNSASENATTWTLANNATTGNVTFRNGAGALTLKLFTTGNISILNVGAITTISSNITDFDATNKGGITKTGAGTLTLNGTNTYTGTTTINAGNLTISGGSAIADTGTVTLANTSGVNFNVNASETIASLQGGGASGGNVTIASGQTLTVAEANTNTFSGSLQGSGNFTKSGAGTLTLNGANTNSGAVSVTGGTVLLSGASALSGSTSLLSASSSTISLADGVGRTITLSNGNLSLSSATMVFELGSTSDSLTLTNGMATLSGTNTISLANLGSFTAGNYTLISAASGLDGGTWSLNSLAGPTGFTYSLNSTATTLSLIATANSNNFFWTGNASTNWSGNNFSATDGGASTLSAGNFSVTSDLIFAAAGAGNLATTMNSNYTVNSLAISSPGVSIGGANTLTVNSTASTAIAVSAASGSTTISANLAGASAGLTKTGAGTLILSGANTFGGGLSISAGTLNLNSSTAAGNGAITISGGTLDNTSGSSVTLSNNNTQSWNGNFAFTGTRDLNMGTGAVALGASRTVTVNGGNLTVGGAISGTGFSLTKAGAGTLVLNGSNAYDGGTTISAGTLQIGNANALGSTGNITFSGGSLQYGSGITQDISSRIRNSGSAIIVDTNNNNVTFGTALDASNTGGLTKQGNGTLTLSVSNTLTGPLQVTGGTLSLSSGTLSINTASASTISGTLSGSGSLTKLGSGTLTISNNNSGYSGETRLEAGVLEIGDNSALGTGTITFRAANSTFRSTDATDRTLSNAIGQFTGADGTTYTFGSVGTGNLTFSGNGSTSLTASGSPTRVFNVLNTTTSFAQSFTGASPVTKTGTGTMILTGASTYTGNTTINAGTLQIGNGGATGSLSISSAITVNGTLAFNRSDALTQGANFSIAAMTGTGSIIKNGTGNLTLNATNTYSGGTVLNSGTLNINNASAIGSGTLAINGGTMNNTSGSAITLSTNNAQSWNSDFAFTGTNNLNLGTGAVAMNASRTVTVNAGNLTVGGSISGSGFGLTKNGSGTLVLSGSNSYTGNTTINSGTVTAAAAGAVGNSSQIIVKNGGSFLVTADDAIGTNTGINLGSGNTTPGLAFSGNYSGHVGALTLSADSIIDLGTSSVRLIFASIAGLANHNLSIWNWSGNTQWSGSPGDGTDQLSFTDASGLSGNLGRISFYSDLGQSLISNNAFTVGSNPTEIVAVPEPGLIITAAALLAFLLFRFARQPREANRVEKF